MTGCGENRKLTERNSQWATIPTEIDEDLWAAGN